jgi:hypothetical protein
MIRIDPGIHALARLELRARRPQLGGDDRAAGAKGSEKVGGSRARGHIRHFRLFNCKL